MDNNSKYNHTKIEGKWQKKWEEEGSYVADIESAKNPFYNLFMFPYPSAEGLHAGHAFSSTGSDVYGRFMRMNGYDVFQPMGWDSFGIHPENYAIKTGEHPKVMLDRTIKHYGEQFRSLGHGYDWTRTVTTSDPIYYRWTQWLFIQMFKAGLAYKKNAEVNFCPSCKTVLADEQVMSPKQAGKEARSANGENIDLGFTNYEDLKVCERCGTVVEKKDLDQWFFRITKYADRLLNGLDKIDWSERVKLAQKEWIGRSEGVIINFKKENGEDLPVFTTRPDTLNAVTFIAIADEKLFNLAAKEKLGEFTHEYAINPLTGKKLPIWKTNYVAPGYGTGNVMGVPAHDKRDMDFAKKYHLDIVELAPEENNFGEKHVNYHLRDWLVSRQRYWGAPIPMIFCESCASNNISFKGQAFKAMPGWPASNALRSNAGWFPVEEKDLPILLPNIKDYKPEGTGRGPLANHKEFYEVKCPNCGGEARRETDVMDTFVDSSWYFLRYPSVGSENCHCEEPGATKQSVLGNENLDLPWNPEITRRWLPVNLYFGGAEHSVLHLMYARFITMALSDLGYLKFDEPFPKFYAHGLMIKDGAKMSKSRGNVVNPDEYVAKFGADTLRLYVMFLGPMDASPDFRDSGIEGMEKFVNRLWRLFTSSWSEAIGSQKTSSEVGSDSSEVVGMRSKLHQTIKSVTEDIKLFKYNTAIAKIMELVNTMTNIDLGFTNYDLEVLAKLIAPFAPHLAEEVWVEVLKQPFSIHKASWPKFDESLIVSDTVVIAVQVNGKVRGTLNIESRVSSIESEVVDLAQSEENVAKWLEGQTIKKTIYVPGKIINFVV